MESTVCLGCGYRVTPIKLFDRDPKTNKPYLLTQCSRDSCKFFIDIEDYTGKSVPKNKKEPGDGNSGRSFWRYNL